MGRKIVRYFSLYLLVISGLYGQAVTGMAGGGGGSGGSSNPTQQCVQTNSVTVTGTTTETTLVGTCAGTGTTTLAANFFAAAGNILRIDSYFQYTGTVNATVFKVKLGGTQIVAGVLTPAAIQYACAMHLIITARSVGSSGTLIANGPILCAGTGAQGDTSIVFNVSTGATINTTGTLAFDFTVTPGAINETFTTTELILAGY